jgi:hypothetical protein
MTVLNIDKTSSSEIASLLQEASSLCEKSLVTVKSREALGIVKVYGRLVGDFMGQAYLNVLAPIWQAYPELMPAEMNVPWVEPAPKLDPESQAAIRIFLAHTSRALLRIIEVVESQAQPVELPFGGLQEVRDSMAAIETFLANPRFHDKDPRS